MTSTKLNSRQEQKQFVLEWVNAQRRDLGMKPLKSLPRGVRGDSTSCVVARGLSNGWKAQTGGGKTTVVKAERRFPPKKRQERVIYHPVAVSDFIYLFDGGSYPELEQ